MKKFLTVLLAIILVLSTATVAFAAPVQTNVCPYCGKFETASAAEYNAHITGGCNVKYRPCQYGCGAGFETNEILAEHEEICPFGSATCDYCGDTFSPVKDYNDHLAACKASHLNIPFAKIVAVLQSIDWGGMFSGLISTITGLVEKIQPLFSGLFA